MTHSVHFSYAKSCFTYPLHLAREAIASLAASLYKLAQKVVEIALSKFFFFGYEVQPPAIAGNRTRELINQKGAYLLTRPQDHAGNVEVLYIPCPSPLRTGNVIILGLNTTYQDHHPKHFAEYLENGAAVVLWNQPQRGYTGLNPKQYAEDLFNVVQMVQRHRPGCNIAIKTHCQSGDPAIEVAHRLQDARISLILDRCHGDVYKLAESNTILAKLPLIRDVFRDKFDCGGIQKIRDVPGPIAFVAPSAGNDEVMQYAGGRKNLTYDLCAQRGARAEDVFVTISGDHWSQWGHSTHNKINDFLSRNGIIAAQYTPATQDRYPDPQPPSLFKRVSFLLLNKSPYDC